MHCDRFFSILLCSFTYFLHPRSHNLNNENILKIYSACLDKSKTAFHIKYLISSMYRLKDTKIAGKIVKYTA